MKKKSILLKMVVLVSAMMCALSANAQEAYVCYTSSNSTLTFCYDIYRSSRPGTTYDLNTGEHDAPWRVHISVTDVVFEPSFAAARPTTTYNWFSGLRNLQDIHGMAYLNTDSVTSMTQMFAQCNKLTSIDLSNVNTSYVRYMKSMFSGCSSLTSLFLDNFITFSVIDMTSMFSGCSSLRTIYVGSGWTTMNVAYSADMFLDCTNLVGGMGTTYDPNNVYADYAHIDGGPNYPGYFTAWGAEAYACYTPENTTLTFYYDIQRSSRTGETYDLNRFSINPAWFIDGISANVTKVVFDPSFAAARPTTTHKWFSNMTILQSITGLEYLNTSEVTYMDLMFSGCSGLTSLDLSTFDTSHATNMANMFAGCSGLTSLNLSGFYTKWVKDMASMFAGCSGLTSLNLSGFDTNRVTDMSYMFSGCSGLTSLNLSGFNTNRVTDMIYMFAGCSNLQKIYAGEDWSTAAVTGSYDMFSNCNSLVGGQGTTYDANHVDKAYAHIDGGPSDPGYFTAAGTQAYAVYTPENTTLTFYYDTERSSRTGTTYSMPSISTLTPGWYSDGTSANVTQVVFDPSFAGYRPTYTYGWFQIMRKLQTITGMSYLKTDKVLDMRYMFQSCSKLTSLDVSHFNTSKATNMNAMFDACSGLASLDLSSFNTSNVTNMARMFTACLNLTAIYVGEGWSTAAVTNSTDMFLNCKNLVGGMGTVYDANHVDKAYAHIDGGTSNPGYFTAAGIEAYACYTPENTTLTFYYDTERGSRPGTTYDLNTGEHDTGWKTDGTNASVTRVIFDPSFAGARPTTTYLWFYLMKNLLTIEGIEYLNTSEVTNMAHMFNTCSSLTSIDLSGFNTSKVTEMRVMFCNCTGLTSLDLSSFNTSKVTNMFNMFGGCSSLTSLDLSSFNTSNVTNMGRMFYGCSRLTTVYVGENWSTEAVTSSSYMFHNNNNLVGGQGTTYNGSNPKDKTYAHIDGGPSNPGYFTAAGTEAYAVYTPENTTITFYCDAERSTRPGTTYDLNTGYNEPGWTTDGTNANVTKVVFDPSFAGARPTTTYEWFFVMQNLETIEGMEYLNTSEVTNMWRMFAWCSELTSLDLSHFNTSKVTSMAYVFYRCTGLTSLDLSSFNTANVTDMSAMFYNCPNLTTVYAGEEWSTEAVTNSTQMFNYDTSLVGGMGTTYDASHIDKAYAHIDGGPSNPGYFTAAGTEAYAVYTPENTTLTFYYDTERDSRLGTTYDLNTGEHEPGWITDDTTDDVTQVVFDPSFANVRPTTTCEWFFGMQNLETIEGMEYLNTSAVTDMSIMFAWCSELTSLDLSHFNTSKVTNMNYLFYRCSGLTSLDLNSFNTSNVTNMAYMFYDCSNLTTIYAGEEWSTEAVAQSTQMFGYATSLVGGMGTTWNESNPKDKTYAHIDGGLSNPGYFTDKNAGLRGDVNSDNNVSIGDVTALIDYLLSGDATGINLAAADCNLDNGVSIGDVTALIDYLLAGSW